MSAVNAQDGKEAYDVVMVGDSGYYDLEKQMSVVGRPTARNVRVVGVIDPNTREYKSAAGVVDDVEEAYALYGALTTAMSKEEALKTAAETAARSAAAKRVRKGSYTQDEMRGAFAASTGMRDGGPLAVAIQQKAQQLDKTAKDIEQKNKVVTKMVSDLKRTEREAYKIRNQLDASRRRITELENKLKSFGTPRTQDDLKRYNKLYEQYTAEVKKYNSLVERYNTLVDEYKSKASKVKAEARGLQNLLNQYWMDMEALRGSFIESVLGAAWSSGDFAAMKWLHESREDVQLGKAKHEMLSKIGGNPWKALAFEFSSNLLSRTDPFGLKSKAKFIEALLRTGDYAKARDAYLITKARAYMEMKQQMWDEQNNKLDIGKTAQYVLASPASFIAYGAVAGRLLGYGLTRLAAYSPTAASVAGAGVTAGGLAYLGYDVYGTAKKEGLASAAARAAEYAVYGVTAGIGAREGSRLARAQIYKETTRSPKKITVVGSRGVYDPKADALDVTANVRVNVTGGRYAGKTFDGKYNLYMTNVDEFGSYFGITQQGSKRATYLFTTTGKDEYAEAMRILGFSSKTSGVGSSGGAGGGKYTLQLAAGSRLDETMVTPHDTSLKTRIFPTISKFQEFTVARKDVSATFGRANVYIPNELKVKTTYLVTKSGPSINIVSYGKSGVDTVVTMIHADELASIGKLSKIKTLPGSGGKGMGSVPYGFEKDAPKIFAPPKPSAVDPSKISKLMTIVGPKVDVVGSKTAQAVRSLTATVTSLPAVSKQLAKDIIASGVEKLAPKAVLMIPAPKATVRLEPTQEGKPKGQTDVSDIKIPKVADVGATAVANVQGIKSIGKKERVADVLPRLAAAATPRMENRQGTSEVSKVTDKVQLKGLNTHRARVKETGSSVREVSAVVPRTVTGAPPVRLKLTGKIPPIATPPLLPPMFTPRVPKRLFGLTVGRGTRKGHRGITRKYQKKSKSAGIPLWFVKPTLPTAHKMIAKFGRVIVPKHPKVTEAYKQWLKKGGIGEFDPLKVVDFKGDTAKGSKTAKPKVLQDALFSDKRKKKKRWLI